MFSRLTGKGKKAAAPAPSAAAEAPSNPDDVPFLQIGDEVRPFHG
jgi:hypothetical protein